MRKLFFTLLLFIPFQVLAHPFYVSIFSIHYQENEKNLQVTIKAFTDDLEKGVSSFLGRPFRLNEELAEEQIGRYLANSFGLMTNGEELNPYYLGIEAELDVTYIYLEVQKIKPPKTVGIKCSFLTDSFEEQANIIHLTCGDKKESLYLDGKSTTGIVKNFCHF